MGDWNVVTMERLKEGDPTSRTHLYRYFCARGFVDPEDVVIDAACGSGYGTELISKVARKAIGMDRDPNAIKYAMENHKQDNNYFICSNLDQERSFPDCDVVVSIETLEHLRYPKSFIGKLKMSARKKIFLTTPIVPTKDTDPTHLHDFTEPEVMRMMVDDNWKNIHVSVQGIYLLAAFIRI